MMVLHPSFRVFYWTPEMIPWIKIETSLPRKPEVMQLAEILGIDEFAVVGHLVCFWSWVDENVSSECPVVIGTKKGLDRVAGRDGFADAMIAVGWLEMDGNSVSIPHLEYHLSKGAKTRAMEARKKSNQRAAGQKADKCPDAIGTKTGRDGGPDKSRVDESRVVEQQTQEHTPKAVRSVFRKPSVQDVAEYVTSICADIDPQTFVDHYEANGWRVGGKAAMKDWKAAVRTWHKRREEQRDHEQSNNAVKAGWTAQARQDAQWAVFAEFDAAARRDAERRAAASGGGGSTGYLSGDHATLFGEEQGADDPL